MFPTRYFSDRMFAACYWAKHGSIGLAPTSEGLEFTLPENRMHFSLSESRMHFTLPRNRMHYMIKRED